jgi:uncharacterized protein (AIM24 family)
MSFYTSFSEEGFLHERRDGRACDLTFEMRGRLAPFVEVTLARGEGLVCDRACVLQHDDELHVRHWPGLNGSRWLVMNASEAPEASVMLSTSEVGFAGAFDLGECGGRLICASGNLMANGPGVTASYYARFRQMGLNLLILEGNGWAFLRSRGDVFEHRLGPGEKVRLRAHSIAAMTATVNLDPVLEAHSPANGHDSDFSLLTGPGTVWLQSRPAEIPNRPPADTAPDDFALREMQTGGLAFLNESNA